MKRSIHIFIHTIHINICKEEEKKKKIREKGEKVSIFVPSCFKTSAKTSSSRSENTTQAACKGV
jgi:hypothetical protein